MTLLLSTHPTAHGTFLGHIRLEPHKPQQVPVDSTMSFGASTRVYTIREKPQSQANVSAGEKTGDDEELKGLLGLPEEETELEVCVLKCFFFFFSPFWGEMFRVFECFISV